MAVAMTLGFPAMDHGKEEMEKEVRQQVGEILNGLSARTMESTLQVKSRQDGTVLTFTLVGDNKIDVASHLEDMVNCCFFKTFQISFILVYIFNFCV